MVSTFKQSSNLVYKNIFNFHMLRGHRGLMVMALDCSAGGCEFKPCHFQNIFDLIERFDGGDEK